MGVKKRYKQFIPFVRLMDMGVMTEFELKLVVPPSQAAAVARAMGGARSHRRKMRAHYLDTAGCALSGKGVSLRLRKEGASWVQTLKCGDRGALERLEHNVPLPEAPARHLPPAILARHEGTPAGELLRDALGLHSLDEGAALQVQFETDVERMVRKVRVPGGVVEVAFDRGKIIAGASQAPICEIEFELLSGEPGAAVRLARRWMRAHGLWLSVASKAERGFRLAAGEDAGDPVPASARGMPRRADGPEVVTAVVHSCLAQILGNASEAASGHVNAEHVHQLRIGIRRMRTALRELAPLASGPDPSWEEPMVRAFRELGAQRDRWHFVHHVQPQVLAAGGPELDLAALLAESADAVTVVRRAEFQDALLQLVEFAHRPNDAQAPRMGHAKAMKRIAQRLGWLARHVANAAGNFRGLEASAQHRIRKRAKRLRYLAEFTAPLYGKEKVRRFIDALKPVQDALGAFNDEVLALAAYRELALRQPQALFGAGWLAGRHDGLAAACEAALSRFATARPFWDVS